MNEMLISFIIPAHNAASTIENAVNSIVARGDNERCSSKKQSDSIEILIIENGSSDDTNGVVEKLSSQWKQVKLFHSDKGVSNARNVGIKNALGKWLVFVDADDDIIPGAMETLIGDANTSEADLILYGHIAGMNVKTVNDSAHVKTYIKEHITDARVRMLEYPTRYMQVWAKLFRRKVIIENNVFFCPELRLSEDSDFTLRYSRYCKKICFSPFLVYQYTLNPDSTMRAFDGEKANDFIKAMMITNKEVADETTSVKLAFDKYVLMHMNILMVREIFTSENPIFFSKKVKKLKQIANEEIFRQAIKRFKTYDCKSVAMLPVFMIKTKMYSLAGLIYVIRVKINRYHEKKEMLE